jgi:hypothetical protein
MINIPTIGYLIAPTKTPRRSSVRHDACKDERGSKSTNGNNRTISLVEVMTHSILDMHSIGARIGPLSASTREQKR